MKQPTKTDSRPKATDTLVNVVEAILAYRYPGKSLSLGDIARVTSVASRILHLNKDERVACENSATLVLAKKLNPGII